MRGTKELYVRVQTKMIITCRQPYCNLHVVLHLLWVRISAWQKSTTVSTNSYGNAD